MSGCWAFSHHRLHTVAALVRLGGRFECHSELERGTRVSVTLAAKDLQKIGYIKYVRGKITVLDRAGLENGACECYKIVKREYDRAYV